MGVLQRTCEQDVNDGWTKSWETGAVVQEGMAHHPARHGEQVVPNQLLGI